MNSRAGIYAVIVRDIGLRDGSRENPEQDRREATAKERYPGSRSDGNAAVSCSAPCVSG